MSGREHTLFIHLTLIPYIAAAGELKTKPTQHSVRELMEIGIQPDVLICRTERPLGEDLKRKTALFTNVDAGRGHRGAGRRDDLRSAAVLPQAEAGRTGVREARAADAGAGPDARGRRWSRRIKRPSHGAVRIAVVGKYTALVDSYKCVQEALIHGGIANDVGVEIDWLSSEDFERGNAARACSQASTALLIPGGFGVRGVEGMLEAVRWARDERAAVLRHLPRACSAPSSSLRATSAASRSRTRRSSSATCESR